jgi:hypothetical protein
LATFRKAMPNKFLLTYTDARDGGEIPEDRQCDTLAEVRDILGGMFVAQRAAMTVYDDRGCVVDPYQEVLA